MYSSFVCVFFVQVKYQYIHIYLHTYSNTLYQIALGVEAALAAGPSGVQGAVCFLCVVPQAVLDDHSHLYATDMRQCQYCKQHFCCMCAPTWESLNRMHVPTCRLMQAIPAETRAILTSTLARVNGWSKASEPQPEAEIEHRAEAGDDMDVDEDNEED